MIARLLGELAWDMSPAAIQSLLPRSVTSVAVSDGPLEFRGELDGAAFVARFVFGGRLLGKPVRLLRAVELVVPSGAASDEVVTLLAGKIRTELAAVFGEPAGSFAAQHSLPPESRDPQVEIWDLMDSVLALCVAVPAHAFEPRLPAIEIAFAKDQASERLLELTTRFLGRRKVTDEELGKALAAARSRRERLRAERLGLAGAADATARGDSVDGQG